jgi:hypothetical protein
LSGLPVVSPAMLQGKGSELLMAQASCQALEKFLRQRIFHPIAINDSGLSVPADEIGRFTTAMETRASIGLRSDSRLLRLAPLGLRHVRHNVPQRFPVFRPHLRLGRWDTKEDLTCMLNDARCVHLTRAPECLSRLLDRDVRIYQGLIWRKRGA